MPILPLALSAVLFAVYLFDVFPVFPTEVLNVYKHVQLGTTNRQ